MAQVLVIDPDRPTGRWLKSVLQREGIRSEIVHTGAEGMRVVAHRQPRVVVLEVDLPDTDGLEIIRRLRADAATRNIGIVVLSARMEIDEIQVGLGAGADEYLVKRPGVDAELIAKIRALATQERSAPNLLGPQLDAAGNGGQIISFCSAKGGTGTTSICVNTAYALTRQNPRSQVLVVDMDFPLGAVGRSIGFESAQTVSRLTHALDKEFQPEPIRSFISPDREHGFGVLLAANDLAEAQSLKAERIVPIFQALRQLYDFVFVDFGRTLSRISLPIITSSDAVVIVLTPDLNTVKMTKLVLHHLTSLGIQNDRIILMNNRTVGRVWISKEEIEKELGLGLAASIPYEMEHVTLAINAGIPYMKKFPERAASMAFTDFARTVVERVRR